MVYEVFPFRPTIERDEPAKIIDVAGHPKENRLGINRESCKYIDNGGVPEWFMVCQFAST